jgi:hypothetical protein
VSVQITFSHVYISRGVVAAWVQTQQNKIHRVGHLPWEGWVCTCPRGRRCPQIDAVKAQVPVNAIELAARAVEAGTVQAGVCTPERRRPAHVV